MALPRSPGRPHGRTDLRGTIVAVTLRQLETTESVDVVTIASIVAEAGCTPPSLYHYWSSRDALLREAGARGWQQFRDQQAHGAAAVSDPIDRLRGRGRAYVDFALQRPRLFQILFLTAHAEVASEPGEGFTDLVKEVNDAISQNLLADGDPVTTALTLWSAAHGVAALAVTNPALAPDTAARILARLQEALLGPERTDPSIGAR